MGLFVLLCLFVYLSVCVTSHIPSLLILVMYESFVKVPIPLSFSITFYISFSSPLLYLLYKSFHNLNQAYRSVSPIHHQPPHCLFSVFFFNINDKRHKQSAKQKSRRHLHDCFSRRSAPYRAMSGRF